MVKAANPELKKFMDKRLVLQLNGNRKVTGVLRGYDLYMNLVLDDTVEEVHGGGRNDIGQVFIRGNSIVFMEALDPVK